MKYPESEKNGFMIISLVGEVDLNYSPVAREQILKYLKQLQVNYFLIIKKALGLKAS